MPRSTAIASASGLTAGIAITVAAADGIPAGSISALALLAVLHVGAPACITFIGMVVMRRWNTSHEESIRQELTELADQRRCWEADYARRAAELSAREDRLNRVSDDGQAQLSSLAKRLDETLAALTEERQSRAQLQQEFDELAADHNAVIQDTLRERAEIFARRSWTAAAVLPGASTIPSPAAPERRPEPRRLPEHRPEHGRPAEGVRDHV